jgi:hypothetical protein
MSRWVRKEPSPHKKNNPREDYVRGYPSSRCSTGKWAWSTRRGAKVAARVKHPDDPRLRAYRCDECSHWHIGHIPPAVARGDMSAAQWYGGRAAPS